jgi:hypothetical protein
LRRIIIQMLLLSFCVSVIAQSNTDLPNIDRLIEIGEIEAHDVNFSSLKNSQLFMDRYKLSDVESCYIGTWLKNDFIDDATNQITPSISFVNFLPNRILSVFCGFDGRFNVLFYDWKIDDGEILVRALAIIELKVVNQEYRINALRLQEQKDYVSLGRIEKFPKGYYQTKPFDWIKALGAQGVRRPDSYVDVKRIRHLLPGSLDNIYTQIEDRTQVRDILLNRRDNSLEYFKSIYGLI